MNLITVTERFPTQESCIEHLEQIRFGGEPFCPLCGTIGESARKKEGSKVGRWNCHACKSSFNVLSKTMFQGTHLPLQKWFCAIALNRERQEKPVQLPACSRLEPEPEDSLVHATAHSG